MARDPRVRMRSGLVVPGVLLTLFGSLAIVYAEALRKQSDFCPDGTWILIAGVCYTVWKLILPFVLIGIVLVITGATAFRSEPKELEGHLHHGTPSHATLATLISLVVVPGLLWIVQTVRQAMFDTVYKVSFLGARWEHTFLLELMMVLGLGALLPYLFLYIGIHRRRAAFIAAATHAMEHPPMEEPEVPAAFEDTVQGEQEQEKAMVPDEDWPAEREGGVIGCMAKDGPRTCPAPVRAGTKYCVRHGCSGHTKDGAPCGNEAVADGRCAVHQAA